MTQSWGEFVHITAHRFKEGNHPWTVEEFYLNSVIQDEASPTVDPICMTIFESEGIRVAESENEWWTDGNEVWSCFPLPLDDNYKLTAEVIRFSFLPMLVGARNQDDESHMPAQSLISYAMDNESAGYVFDLTSLMDLFNKHSKGKDELRIMTLWSCSAGFSYVPGEPDEYDESWYLIGVVKPLEDGIEYEKL